MANSICSFFNPEVLSSQSSESQSITHKTASHTVDINLFLQQQM